MENNLKHQIVSGVVWRFAERFSAQAVAFIVSLVLARLLSPHDYGTVAIVSIFVMLASVFVTNGLNAALIQDKKAGQEEFSTIFYCNFIIAVVFYSILYFSAPYIAKIYQLPELKSIIRVYGTILFPSCLRAIQEAFVSKQMIFKKFFFSTIGGTLVSAVVGIEMALYGFGCWALVAQSLTNTVIDTSILFLMVRWKPSLYFKPKKCLSLIKYGLATLGANLIGTFFNQIQAIVIGKKYTPSDLAFYNKGANLPLLISSNISGTVVSVFFPAMSNAKDKDEIKKIAKQGTRHLAYIVIPMMIGLAAVAEPLVTILFTDKWLPIVPFLRLVCIAEIIGILDAANGLQVVRACGRADLVFKLEFIKKPICLIILLISMQYGVVGVASSLPIGALFAMTVNSYAASKFTGYKFTEELLDVMPAFTMSAIMGITVFSLSFLSLNVLLMLLLQVTIGIMLYILMSYMLKIKEFTNLCSMIAKRLKK